MSSIVFRKKESINSFPLRFQSLFRFFFLSFWGVVVFMGSSIGCSHFGSSIFKVKTSQPPERVEIRFRPNGWKTSTTAYHSYSMVKDMEEDQVTREKIEELDFEVQETLVQAFGEKGQQQSQIKAKTIKKDGTADLHDFSFPELNEEIEYLYDDRSQVLKAGIYPPETSFFTPPLPTPVGLVMVGDTWTLDHTWLSMKSGVPLTMNLVSILKGIVSCGSAFCYDIEISGQVQIEGVKLKTAEFSSTLWGRLLYHPGQSQILWSEIRSKELMIKSSRRTHVISCMGARLKGKLGDEIPSSYSKKCKAIAAPL